MIKKLPAAIFFILCVLGCWPASSQALPLKYTPDAVASRSGQDNRAQSDETFSTVYIHLTAADINSRDTIDVTDSNSGRKNDFAAFISLLENKFTIQRFLFSSPYREIIIDQELKPDFFGGMLAQGTDTDRSQQVFSRPPPSELGTSLIAVLVPMMILGAGLFGFIPLRLSIILLFIWFTSWVLLSSIVLRIISIFTDTIGLLFQSAPE